MASVLCLVKDMVAWRTRCLSCKQVPEQCTCTIWYDIVWLVNHETSQQDITTQSQEKKPKRKNNFSRLSDSNSKLWVWPCRLSCLPELSGKAQWLQLGQQSLAFIFQLLFRYSECFWLLDGLFECKHVGWDSESASIGDCKILQPKGDGDGGGDIDFQLPLDAGRKAIILKCGLSSGWRSFKTFSAWSSRGARSGAYLCSCTRQSHLKSSYAPQLQSSFKKGPGRHGLFLQNQWDETAIVRTRLGH